MKRSSRFALYGVVAAAGITAALYWDWEWPQPDAPTLESRPRAQKLTEQQEKEINAKLRAQQQNQQRAAEEVQRQALAEQQQEKETSAYRVLAFTVSLRLQEMMRDPESFKLIQVFYTPDDYLCYTYSAKNGFGGRTREHAVYTPKGTLVLGNPGVWNAHCGRNSKGIILVP